MLLTVRKLLSNWVARVCFGLLVVVFVFWGVQNVFTMVSASTAIASVAGQAIDATAVQAAYQATLKHEQTGNSPPPDVATRQGYAEQAIEAAIEQKQLALEEQRLGVTVPDANITQALDAVPEFQSAGVFDKATFENVLAQNNVSATQFLTDERNVLTNQQFFGAVTAGAIAPTALAGQLFDYLAEQRQANLVFVPFGAQAVPPAPSDEVLQRYWRNNQQQFMSPEYRTVKIVVLSPFLLAPQEQVPDSQVQAVYARATGDQKVIALRSVQVITAPDTETAGKLVAAWNKGADWGAMQALATKLQANPVELDKASQAQIPAAPLAQAVFAAPLNVVVGPVQGPFGQYVFKVTDIENNGPDKAAMLAQLKQAIQGERARADVAQDANALQDALAAQTPLDQLPANPGFVAVQGTLDAKGNTPDGSRAPVPGAEDVRDAIVKAVFAATPGAAPQMLNGPGGTYFAVSVDKVTPSAVIPFAQAHAAVLAAWTTAQQAHEAETKAANLLQALNGGQNFQAAAAASGLQVSNPPPVSREEPKDSPQEGLSKILFAMTPGQPVMQKLNGAFLVAELASVTHPSPTEGLQNVKDYQELAASLNRGMQDDVLKSLLIGLGQRYPASQVNQQLLTQIYQ
jgi:peptidyl-prolyl cis-trans isomerase D